jgi:hypothetical protein
MDIKLPAEFACGLSLRANHTMKPNCVLFPRHKAQAAALGAADGNASAMYRENGKMRFVNKAFNVVAHIRSSNLNPALLVGIKDSLIIPIL